MLSAGEKIQHNLLTRLFSVGKDGTGSPLSTPLKRQVKIRHVRMELVQLEGAET